MRTAASGSSISPICRSGRVIRSAVRQQRRGAHRVGRRSERAASFELAWLAAARSAAALHTRAAAGGCGSRARGSMPGATSPREPRRSCAPRRPRASPGSRGCCRMASRFSHDVPATRAAILEVMPLVGRVLETNYGLTFDVRSVPQPREPRLLRSRARAAHRQPLSRAGAGIPGAARAALPRAKAATVCSPTASRWPSTCGAARPMTFARLTATAVPFHYRSPDADLYAERPLIQLSVRAAR